MDHTPPGWAQEQNGGGYLPVAGDIIVWGPVDSNGNPDPNANGDAGHVAIIYTTSKTGATTWSVVAVNENFANSSSSPPISRSTGTITQVRADGLILYVLNMNEGVAGSQLYGVLHHA